MDSSGKVHAEGKSRKHNQSIESIQTTQLPVGVHVIALENQSSRVDYLGMSNSRQAGTILHTDQRDARMATVTRAPGKSDFIKQVLGKNPQATFKAVNEAWTEAGFDGSISQALVNKMRSEAGLSGNLRTNGKVETPATEAEKPAPTGKKRGRKPKRRARDQGKTSFIKEFLNDHPEGNVKAVNEAWTKAGFDGSISGTLVNRMRSQLGLTGNLRRKSGKTKAASGTKPYTGKKRGRKPKGFTAEATPVTATVETRGRKSALTLGLNELEADIDRLVFKVMGIGNLPEIEDSLRQVRRHLYGKLNQG